MTNTGLNDFGENDFRQPLALLLNSLEKEAELRALLTDDEAYFNVPRKAL